MKSTRLAAATKLVIALAMAATTTGVGMAQTRPLPPSPVCIDDSENCVTHKLGIKWNPGHYAETQTYGYIPSSAVTDISTLPDVQGIVQRYNWSTLEPSRGKYDFSAIHSDLAKLRPYGKRLVVLLMDRSWAGTSTAALPGYLATEPNSNNGIVLKPNNAGVIARIWNAAVMDRMIALSAALAAEFDDEPLFEGLRFEEITPGMSPGATGVPTDYTVAALISQWTRLATASRQHWSRTNVFFNTNTLGGITGPLKIIEHGYQIGGIGAGGPDVLPPGADDHKISGDRVITRTPDTTRGDDPAKFIRDYRGRVPIFHSVQTPALGGKEGTFMPAELADYAILGAGDTHLAWVMAPSTVTINWSSHIRPYLAGNPRPTVQSCPTSYANGCATE